MCSSDLDRQPRQSVGKFLHWKQTAAKNGPLLSIAERDYLTALVADLKALYWQQPSEGKDAYELLAEELNSAKVMRDELLELFAVNARLLLPCSADWLRRSLNVVPAVVPFGFVIWFEPGRLRQFDGRTPAPK